MKLNEKQRIFVLEYLQDLNATQAAIRAGYSRATAYSQGQRLLKNVEVKKQIEQYLGRREAALIATAEEIKEFWSGVMNNEELPLKDRLKASEMLAKSLGTFIVRIEATQPNKFVVHWADSKEEAEQLTAEAE